MIEMSIVKDTAVSTDGEDCTLWPRIVMSRSLTSLDQAQLDMG